LARVIDPAGGSYYVEMLTTELAGRAWSLFQEVEKRGGMEDALREGFPQQAVGFTAAEKIKAVNRRRDALVGVNQYANAKEKRPEAPVAEGGAFHRLRVLQVAAYRTNMEDAENELVLKKLTEVIGQTGPRRFEACAAAAAAGATLGEIARTIRIHDTPCVGITPVCLHRAAEGFERLRAALDGQTIVNKNVFLCNLGTLADYKARADFSRGFLAVGGYSAISPEGFASPAEAAKAFAGSKCRVAVICSTDEKYPALVPDLARAIRAERPDAVLILAGFPQAHVENLKKAGVDEFIHVRADALEVLTAIHRRLGIEL